MRNALLAVVAVVAAVVAGWILDDKLLGGDIARNTSIAGVDVGRLNIDEAAELLTDGRLTDRPIELRHDTNTLTITAAELGVMVDAELALADAAEQPDLIAQPIRWIGSLFRNRSFDVRYTVDVDVLGEVVAGSDSFFDLDFGLPQLELVNGRFVEADVASLPIVDTDELRNLVLDAAITGGNGTAVIEIPIIGSEAVDRGADELIAEAHRLTKNGIALRVPGVITRRRVSQSALRSWLVFGGTIDEPTISLDEQLVQSTSELRRLYVLTWPRTAATRGSRTGVSVLTISGAARRRRATAGSYANAGTATNSLPSTGRRTPAIAGAKTTASAWTT